MRRLLTTFVALLAYGALNAQTHTIEGSVTDGADGSALIGVTISLDGTAIDLSTASPVCDEDWITTKWENTSNYNLQVTVAENTTTAARTAKVYVEYGGVRSNNYITVNQDAGTGEVEEPENPGEGAGETIIKLTHVDENTTGAQRKLSGNIYEADQTTVAVTYEWIQNA